MNFSILFLTFSVPNLAGGTYLCLWCWTLVKVNHEGKGDREITSGYGGTNNQMQVFSIGQVVFLGADDIGSSVDAQFSQ